MSKYENKQYEDAISQYESQLNEAKMNAEQSNLSVSQQQLSQQYEDGGIVREQLDLTEILENVHNLLRGYVLIRNKETGQTEWMEPLDNDMVILTDHGINYIMGAVQFYLNKNTLLSNYSEEQINTKMEDFAVTLIDDVFMESDKMFLYPSLDDCKDEVRARIQRKKNLKKFTRELLGLEYNDAETEKIIVKEMEGRIEEELSRIKEQKIKNKLKRFESLMRFIQDTVHSAYQRAWNGQERRTLRQHIHVSENKGGLPQSQPKHSSLNPLAFFRSS